MKKMYFIIPITLLMTFVTFPSAILSQDEPPPLPAQGIEGYGGIFSTYCAYLVNTGQGDTIWGLPSVAYTYVHFGHGRDLSAFTITEVLWDRVELGYGFDLFDMGDLPDAIATWTPMRMGDDYVGLHNFNVRLALFHENDFEQPWLPAVTFGVHYKYNDTVDDINRDLLGTLRGIGIEEDDGVDFTLYASKTVPIFTRPVIFNLGLRESRAAHIGFLGFTNDYELTVEGSVAVLLTNHILFGGEYRMKPDNYTPVSALVGEEEDWWTVCLGYIVNEHLCLDFGYGHFGQLLNHEANGSWGVRVKWEF